MACGSNNVHDRVEDVVVLTQKKYITKQKENSTDHGVTFFFFFFGKLSIGDGSFESCSPLKRKSIHLIEKCTRVC